MKFSSAVHFVPFFFGYKFDWHQLIHVYTRMMGRLLPAGTWIIPFPSSSRAHSSFAYIQVTLYTGRRKTAEHKRPRLFPLIAFPCVPAGSAQFQFFSLKWKKWATLIVTRKFIPLAIQFSSGCDVIKQIRNGQHERQHVIFNAGWIYKIKDPHFYVYCSAIHCFSQKITTINNLDRRWKSHIIYRSSPSTFKKTYMHIEILYRGFSAPYQMAFFFSDISIFA
jgi:hypothetical protein